MEFEKVFTKFLIFAHAFKASFYLLNVKHLSSVHNILQLVRHVFQLQIVFAFGLLVPLRRGAEVILSRLFNQLSEGLI